MANYTKESPDQLYKKDLISIVLSLQAEKESAVTKILDEVRALNEKFTSLESQLLVTKNIIHYFKKGLLI